MTTHETQIISASDNGAAAVLDNHEFAPAKFKQFAASRFDTIEFFFVGPDARIERHGQTDVILPAAVLSSIL